MKTSESITKVMLGLVGALVVAYSLYVLMVVSAEKAKEQKEVALERKQQLENQLEEVMAKLAARTAECEAIRTARSSREQLQRDVEVMTKLRTEIMELKIRQRDLAGRIRMEEQFVR